MSKNNAAGVATKEIDEIEGVYSHFQTDRDFVKCYASDEDSSSLGDISSVCLNFARSVAESGGFGSLSRVVTYSKGSKFALFALHSKKGSPPGVRSFGVTMDSSADLDGVVSQINNLI